MVERTTEGRERAKRQGKHMGRPGQDEKTLKRAIKLYNERETNRMSVNDIVKATGVPRLKDDDYFKDWMLLENNNENLN
ncbi:hypothetical protein CN689_21755 [Peribacillus butanolivorans]|uniref:Resolvase/invertase-type recombinase catalytic domain-containing protein n=1 Tax=Peribacillus butanolivorans TaxID=421767 RepID=A0AAX0RZI1_9BACI|nr:hypothetical protein CN689_21755 [Peribacillus butanolivorans]